MPNKLTDKQKRFAEEYLCDLNATQSAIRAGYSHKSASRIAIELLNKTHVQKYIQGRQVRLQKKTEITQERVIAELAAIGFAEATDFAPDGIPMKPEANYKGSSKLKALELIGRTLGIFDRRESGESTERLEALRSVFEDIKNGD